MSLQPNTNAVVWLRRDLRLSDHRPLDAAVHEGHRIQHVFVFDTTILNELENKQDRRVEFIHESLGVLDQQLKSYGGSLVVLYGDPTVLIPKFCMDNRIDFVYTAKDYEKEAIAREQMVANLLARQGVQWASIDDQVVFGPNDIMQANRKPYVVYTPYSKRWLAALDTGIADASVDLSKVLWLNIPGKIPSLPEIGFATAGNHTIGLVGGEVHASKMWDDFKKRIKLYNVARDYPAVKGTSYLSVHFRFGTLSVRQCIRELVTRMNSDGVLAWVKEIAWRDFYAQLLYHFPNTVSSPFQTRYASLLWNENAVFLEAWSKGLTGYPLVDAAQRQLLATGYMHNRLRMVSASFFSKHLGLDWRLGENFFATHLNDYDMASNVGGWQWASSIGSDAQPYFRVFNPTLQSEKFDADGKFIYRYCPELKEVPIKYLHAPWLMTSQEQEMYKCIIGVDYPWPIIEHKSARLLAIAKFKQA